MQSALDFVKLTIRCAISLELPTVAVNCSCGHLFNYVHLASWVLEHHDCPISRQRMTLFDIRANPTVQQLIDSGLFSSDLSSTISTQTDDFQTPQVSTQSSSSTTDTQQLIDSVLTSIQPVTISHGDDSVHFTPILDDDMWPSQDDNFVSLWPIIYSSMIQYDFRHPIEWLDRINSGTLVNLAMGLFNPASGSQVLSDVVTTLNHQFLLDYTHSTFFENGRIPDYTFVVYYKYIYHSRLGLVDTAIHLLNLGYYVYDLFPLDRSDHQANIRYVLYSFDRRRNGVVNHLPYYRRFTHRY